MLIDLNTFTVLGIPPYFFFATVGVIVGFGFYIISIAFIGKPVHGNAVIMFLSFIGLFIGAIAFSLLTKICIALYNGRPIVEAFTNGFGIVFYGGLTGYIISFSLLQRLVYKTIDKQVFNIMVTSIPLFHAIARLGCVFAGCCYGKKTDFELSIQYVFYGETEAVRVFPVQVVESLVNVAIFVLLLCLLTRKPDRPLLPIYLTAYAICRFFLEFLRGDEARGEFGIMSFSQIYSILILVAVAVIVVKGKRRLKNEVV